MIRIAIHHLNQQVKNLDWNRPVLTIGRAATNDLVFAADNVSSQHAQILLLNNNYIFRDLHSTNGSILIREGKKYLLKGDQADTTLEQGDRLCLASMEHEIVVEAIAGTASEDSEENYENTILAEEASRPAADLEVSLGDDSDALRATVRLARELAGLETLHEIAELVCRSCLAAFLRARQAILLAPDDHGYRVECSVSGESSPKPPEANLMKSRQILERCLAERKGFLFLIEHNRMRAVATMIASEESFDGGTEEGGDRVILCCPLFHKDRCFGFLEVEAPLGADRQSLTRRDLSLVTLMGHLVAGRLADLESQRMRLKLARKATAGYLAATVGHCFKNLLFVPNSLSKLLPLSIERGNMAEVQWMLARNSVNIKYLDILSNEFAAASKDPTQGFEECGLDRILEECATLVNQISPDKVAADLSLPVDIPRVVCHGGALRRLLMNLTLNAVDAFFGAGMAEKGLITLKAEAGEDTVKITVRDNGPGIPDAILGNLREIFRQVQSSADALGELQNIAERVRSTKDQGFKEHYGLGFLFVCQTVTAHQGDMTITSAPGKGTQFEIVIPRKSAITEQGAGPEDENTPVRTPS